MRKTTISDAPIKARPFAVSIAQARVLLGNKSRSEIYIAAGRGELQLVKDGAKTLVVLESIENRQRSLPPLKVKPSAPRSKHAAAVTA
jgi:hypothetical protein